MASVLNAVAALIAAVALPSVALVIALLYHQQIADVLPRLKKGKLLGQEIEIESRAREANEIEAMVGAQVERLLHASTIVAAESTNEANPAQTVESTASPTASTFDLAHSIDRILSLGATSPRSALIAVRYELGRSVMEILKAAGDPAAATQPTTDLSVAHLHRLGGSYAKVADALREYLENLDRHLITPPTQNREVEDFMQQAQIDIGTRYIHVASALASNLRMMSPAARDEAMHGANQRDRG